VYQVEKDSLIGETFEKIRVSPPAFCSAAEYPGPDDEPKGFAVEGRVRDGCKMCSGAQFLVEHGAADTAENSFAQVDFEFAEHWDKIVLLPRGVDIVSETRRSGSAKTVLDHIVAQLPGIAHV
jgi:hypothetical protein